MNTPDAHKLVERVRWEESEAFNEIVRLFHPPLFRLARRLLRNPEDAREAVQEAFLAAHQGIGTFEEGASPRTWLLSIAFTKAVHRSKKETREHGRISGDLAAPKQPANR